MKEKGKKGGKSSFDILTLLGILVGLFLMWFGISYAGAEPTPPSQDDFKYALFDEEGNIVEGSYDEEAFNKAMVAHNKAVATWRANGGTFNMSQLGKSFVDVPSIAITVGGTFAALMIAFPLSVYARFPKLVAICFVPNKHVPQNYIDQIVEFAKEARIKGLLSLEDKLAEAQDPFLKSSLMLVVDSVEPEKVHNLLEAELDKMDERHGIGRNFMDSGGAYAPGFGMIGTLIGLVNMLGSMDDPSSIGPAMAVALLTTLYGSFMANMVFSPMSTKLGIRHDEEMLCRELIVVGVEAIQAGENPKFIEEKLNLLVSAKSKGKGKKAKAEKE